MVGYTGRAFEDPVAELVSSMKYHRIKLQGAGWKVHEGDVIRRGQLPGDLPAGLIEQEYGVSAGSPGQGDFFEIMGHG